MCQVSLFPLPLALLMLIFTPHTHTTFRRNDRASTHIDRLSHETDVELWTQLIAYARCPHVVLLDSFEFFAQRPTFARQLFARLTVIGVRVSVRRHLRVSERLTPATHRLAIIVPIVMNPSKTVTDELEKLFGQIAIEESNFDEFYWWLFLFLTAPEKPIQYALQTLPIRADSNVYCAIVGNGYKALPFDHPIHLERKQMPIDRYVRRMQMMMVHPEAANRTVATLMLPCRHTRSATLAVWQLYRLETRTKTIDVAVELLGRYNMC
uniref:Uncharacterized protein n=1 Tax=Anopheles maculatus TaxID=74869 RepID=A0A182SXC4_9DIPT